MYVERSWEHTTDETNKITKTFYSIFQSNPSTEIQQYAATEHTWRHHIPDIQTKLEPVVKELIKQLPNMDPNKIREYIQSWIASISWNESLRNMVLNGDLM